MVEAKRHHTIPQFYLRGFAKNERLTTVRLPGEKRFSQVVRRAASQNDFYTIDGHPDGADVFEKQLANIEGQASKVFAQIVQGEWPLTQVDRMTLAIFIVIQALRGPDQRHNIEYIASQFTRLEIGYGGREGVKAWVEQNYAFTPTDSEVKQIWTEATRPEGPPITMKPIAHIKQMLEMADEILPFIAGRPWTLVKFQRRSLITSDTPVSLIPDLEEERFPFEGVGFFTAWGITYPLTRKLGLLMSDPAPLSEFATIEDVLTGRFDRTDPGTTAAEKFFNSSTAQSARAWVYHHPDDEKYVPHPLPESEQVSVKLFGSPEDFSGDPLLPPQG